MVRQRNLTVSSVLSLEALRGVEILAGRTGLGNRVLGVNIIEVPEVARWLQGGEFLLSSAYLWRDRPDEMGALVSRLHEVGVAALGHKPGDHLHRLPQHVLDLADELGFPIVQLPEQLAYRDILEGVYVLLFGPSRTSQRPDMARELGLEPNDHSMERAVRRLGRHFGWTLMVDDRLEGVMYTATADGESTAVPSASKVDDGSTRGLHLRSADEPVRVMDEGNVAWVTPLVVDGQVRGRLEVTGDDDVADTTTLMEVADYLSLLQIRRRAYLDGQHEALALTFGALARGHLDDDEIVDRAQLLGLQDGVPWAVAVVALSGVEATRPAVARIRALADVQLPAAVTVVATEPVELRLVLLLRGDVDIDSVIDSVRGIAASVLYRVPRVRVGRSATTNDVRQVPAALRQAHIALDVASARGAERIVLFDRLGAEAVLAQVPAGEVTDAFLDKRIGAIEDPELLRTLELYVANHGNKSATAAAIPMHRSGLAYRLDKIGTLMGADLNEPEVMNELWLALKLRLVQRPDTEC